MQYVWIWSQFSLQSDSSLTLIQKTPGTRYHQNKFIERLRYGARRLLDDERDYTGLQYRSACSNRNINWTNLCRDHSETTCSIAYGFQVRRRCLWMSTPIFTE
ncbi:hypothetical protein TNCV_2154161 [Trichonephila clavipes]|nr:hypothetical protein TNCV_2154161 [Trichonephila clavipes]